MAKTVEAARDIVARLRPDDTIAVPLAPGQPRSLLRALGERDDWRGLTVFTGLLTEPYPVFTQPGVRLVSGFFGPIERMLRQSGATVEYLPRDFLGWRSFARAFRPRVVVSALAAPDDQGWCSFSLHAGATFDEFMAASRDPDRLALAEINSMLPRIAGIEEVGGHRIARESLDAFCESDEAVFELPDEESGDVDARIAALVEERIESGSTLQIGIGGVPNMVARLLAGGSKRDFGVHTEMMVDGIRHLHEAGKVVNRGVVYEGKSIATFGVGSRALYDWLDGNGDVRFLPVQFVNDPAIIRRNPRMVSINGALAIDLHGQVMADTLHGQQYSGVGGQEEFVMGARESEGGQTFFCLRSTAGRGDQRVSTIVANLDGGLVTTPRHHLQFVVTEHGVADLSLSTDRERGEALIRIAHPDFREGLASALRSHV